MTKQENARIVDVGIWPYEDLACAYHQDAAVLYRANHILKVSLVQTAFYKTT